MKALVYEKAHSLVTSSSNRLSGAVVHQVKHNATRNSTRTTVCTATITSPPEPRRMLRNRTGMIYPLICGLPKLSLAIWKCDGRTSWCRAQLATEFS